MRMASLVRNYLDIARAADREPDRELVEMSNEVLPPR